MTFAQRKSIWKKTEAHPCYNCGAGRNARIHLPVAPKCNIQCNYCVRKYDCPNESRPGVTAQVISPKEAAQRFAFYREKMDNLKVVGIAGPGDALANIGETFETFRLIREFDPDITFCLSTNGLMLPHYAQELIDAGVSHVTVTLNAIDPKVGALIYSRVDYMGTRFTGEKAADILIANQLAGLEYLAAAGLVCKVNTVALKGINDEHIMQISEKINTIGVYIHNVMKMIPVKGSRFENLPALSNAELSVVKEKGSRHIKQMHHCRQCRSDAVGILSTPFVNKNGFLTGRLCLAE